VKAPTPAEQTKRHEHLVIIVWQLFKALSGEDGLDRPTHVKICFERLCFKLLENNLQKM
jgi:hypothetical protein